MLSVEIMVTCLLAGGFTYYLNHQRQVGAVLASAVTTLVAGLLLPQIHAEGTVLAVAATCVSYAGMSSKRRVTSLKDMAFVSLIVGAIFSLGMDAYHGVGGRLGTMAAISVLAGSGVRVVVKKILPSR